MSSKKPDIIDVTDALGISIQKTMEQLELGSDVADGLLVTEALGRIIGVIGTQGDLNMDQLAELVGSGIVAEYVAANKVAKDDPLEAQKAAQRLSLTTQSGIVGQKKLLS